MATRKTSTKKAAEPVVEAVEEAVSGDLETVEVSEETVPLLRSDRMVVFFLEKQKYALPIDRVQEIQQIVAYTEVPDESGVILGMVNLRGLVVPLLDMRRLVGLSERPFNVETPMIICRLRGSLVALLVDGVEDVAVMPEGCLQRPSRLHALAEKMLGVCRMDPDLIFLLDLERLIPDDASAIGVMLP